MLNSTKIKPMALAIIELCQKRSAAIISAAYKYFVNCIFYLKFHVSLDGHNRELVNGGGEKG